MRMRRRMRKKKLKWSRRGNLGKQEAIDVAYVVDWRGEGKERKKYSIWNFFICKHTQQLYIIPYNI